LTVPTDDGLRTVRVNAIGIPLAGILEGLRTGDGGPLALTVDQIQAFLPVTVAHST
jgi:hypothetical protein